MTEHPTQEQIRDFFDQLCQKLGLTEKRRKTCYALIVMDILIFDEKARMRATATFLINDFMPALEREGWTLEEFKLYYSDPALVGDIVMLRMLNLITAQQARLVIPAALENCYLDLAQFVMTSDIFVEASTDATDAVIATVITGNPKVVDQIKSGKTQAVGFLVGAVLKQVKADPATIKQKIESALGI